MDYTDKIDNDLCFNTSSIPSLCLFLFHARENTADTTVHFVTVTKKVMETKS